jgi:hypothetical protein
MQRKRFRSSVLLQFGPPLTVEAARAAAPEAVEHAWAETASPSEPTAGGTEPSQGSVVVKLTAEIDHSLRALTVNASDWETLRVLDGFRRLYQPAGISIEERVELARRFNAVYPTVKDDVEVKALYQRVVAYIDRLDAEGLADRDLARTFTPGETAGRIARHLLLLIVWLPLALPGVILHAPAGLLVGWTAPMLTPRKDVLAATKLLAGLLVVLVSYGAGILWLGWAAGVPAALGALAALPVTGYATLRVFDRSASLRRGLTTLVRLWSLGQEVAALRAERAALEEAVIRAVNRLRPADMAPLFPRDPVRDPGGHGTPGASGTLAS